MLTSWKKLLLSLVLIFGFTSGAYAVGTPVTSNPYLPHVFVAGAAGSGVVGTGDVLAPIWLKNDRNFFFYGQGNYGYADQDWADNPWSGSGGFGYRQIGNHAVYGLFVLGDYNHTLTNHDVWQVSPGLEILGRAWEFRANGYIPLGDKNWNTQGWADEFGNYDYVSFRGHSMYDAWFIYHEEVGGGADAEVGRVLFKVKNVLVRGLVNGYYYHMTHNTNLRGGGASIEVEPNTYLKFTAKGSYDNYAHTQVAVGVQVSLYDLFSSDSKVLNDQDLQRRLFEPVQRDFANVASASDIRTAGSPDARSPNGGDSGGSPEVITWYDHNAGNPERTNVWFFNGSGVALAAEPGLAQAVADGTYENPYTSPDFNQGTVNGISNYTAANGYAQAYLYFNPATYNANAGVGVGIPIQILSNLSLWGRMGTNKGFAEPATGNNRALFLGGMQLDSSTSVNNTRLQNDAMGNFATGILMSGAANVGINDSEIGVDGPTGSYVTGVTMEDSTNLTISGSNVYGYYAPTPVPSVSGPGVDDAVGIEVINGGNITATKGSLIQGHSVTGSGIGIYVAPTTDGSGNVSSTIGNISGDKTAIFKGISDNANGYGLYAVSDAAVVGGNDATTTIGNISGSTFNGTGDNTGAGLWARSWSMNGNATTGIGPISGSTFTGYASGSGGWNGYGLYAYSSSDSGAATTTISNISGSTFNGTSDNNIGAGLWARSWSVNGNAAITIGPISDSTFTGNASGSGGWGGYGLYAYSSSDSGAVTTTIGNITGSTFNGTGNNTGAGLWAQSGSMNGNATTGIGPISDSTFTGTSTVTGFGYGLYAYSDSSLGGAATTTIGNISGSTFDGTSDNNIGAGLWAQSGSWNGNAATGIGPISDSTFTGDAFWGYGLYANAFDQAGMVLANVTIGDIANSTFEGTGFVDAGLYASTEDGFMGPLMPGNITIGNITNSHFTGDDMGTGLGGYGLYAATDETDGMSTVSIANTVGGQISGNTFTGIGSIFGGGDLWLNGSRIFALGNGTDYVAAGAAQLLSDLTTAPNANTFSGPVGQKVCINGLCV